MDKFRIKTEAKVKEVKIKQDGTDVKFDGLSFTSDQHKELSDVAKSGEGIQITIESNPLQLFAGAKKKEEMSIFRQDFANNKSAFCTLIATAAREARDHVAEEFVTMEPWDNAANFEKYELLAMAAIKARNYAKAIALSGALWNLCFFENPQPESKINE